VVGDFDGDGNLDVALAQMDLGQVDFFFGNGDGTFSPPQYSSLTPSAVSMIGATSGVPSKTLLGVLDQNAPAFFVAEMQADRSIAIASSIAVSYDDGWAGNASVADVNGDGIPDFIVNLSDPDFYLQVYLGTDAGGIVASQAGSAGCENNDNFVGDFNEDGAQDVIAQYCFDTAPLYLFLGNGDGSFRDAGIIAENLGTIVSFLIGDLNEDGHLDLIVDGSWRVGTGWTVLLGVGDGTFVSGPPLDLGDAYSFALADLNNDGHLDFVGSSSDTGGVRVAMGNGDGTFQAWSDLGADLGYLDAVVVADVNKDGRPDLVASDLFSQNVGIFLNCP
jgi:hypothetical protein